MKQPHFSPRARLDLLELWLRIAEASSVERADAYLGQLQQVCSRLAENPGLGRPRGQWGRGVRSVSFGNYLILYRVIGRRVRITRVVHGARDLDELFDQ